MRTSQLRLIVLAGLGLLAGPARATLQVADEHTIDAPASGPASLDQMQPSIAFGAGVYLAVWRDGNKDVGQVWSIRAARIKPDGTFLDDPPILLRNAGEDLVRPAVAFDGQSFLVVWERAAANGVTTSTDIFGCYISPATGEVGEQFLVAGGASAQTQPSAIGGDGQVLVTYNEFATADGPPYFAQTIWGALIAQGQAVKPNFQLSGFESIAAQGSTSAWSASAKRFLVAWRDTDVGGNIWATEVDATGAATTPVQVNDPTAQDPTNPDAPPGYTTENIAVDVLGSTFVVGWADERTYPRSIYAATVPAGGAPSAPFLVAQGKLGGAVRPQLLATGGQLVALWEALNNDAQVDIYGGRFTTSGTRSDGDGIQLALADPIIPGGFPGTGTSYRKAVASSGDTGLVVWHRQGDSASKDDVLLLPIDPANGKFAGARPKYLARQANLERVWSVGTNGELFLLVWEDSRSENADGGLDVYGLRVGLDGAPLDSAPFLISSVDGDATSGAPGDQWAPVVAGIPGGPFLVVWSDARGFDQGRGFDLYGARVGASGPPEQLPQHIFAAVGAQLHPAIAASDAGWLIAWEDYSLTATVGAHRSAVFSELVPKTDGGEPFFAHQLSLASALQQTACAPTATWNGEHFFVAYEQPCRQDFNQPQSDLVGRWHAADGTPLGTDVLIADQNVSETAPAAAALDGRVFLAWRQQTGTDAIFVTTFADLAEKSEQSARLVYSAQGVRDSPSLAAAGGSLLVTWVDGEPKRAAAVRLRATAALEPLDHEPFVLYDGALDQGPGVLTFVPELEGTSLSFTPLFTAPASVVATAHGETLVAYNVLETRAGIAVPRAHWRKLGLAGNGAACSSSGACADGICTAGTCCDVVCDGACQACSVDGCVATPPSDARCPYSDDVSCAFLSTSCRVYAETAPAGAACTAFGQCASQVSPLVCTEFTDMPDGTPCSAPGCTVSASCQGGTCACPTDGAALPPAHTLGCSAAPGRPGAASGASALVLLLLAALLVLRRRRRPGRHL